MFLGILVPLVQAAPTGEVQQSEAHGLTIEEALKRNRPTKLLPAEFEYKVIDNVWQITRRENNSKPAVIIDGLPLAGYDGEYITIFFGNVKTHEVTPVELSNSYSFVKSLDLEPGYYVVFSNNYAYSDSNNKAYAVEGGKLKYIYIGNDYNPDAFSVPFDLGTDGFIHLNLSLAPKGAKIMKYNERISPLASGFEYPKEAALKEKSAGPKVIEPNTDSYAVENKTEKSTDNTSKESTEKENPTESNKEKVESQKTGLWNVIKNMFSKSILLIVGLAGCYVALIVVRAKKRHQIEEQTENDKGDEGRLD